MKQAKMFLCNNGFVEWKRLKFFRNDKCIVIIHDDCYEVIHADGGHIIQVVMLYTSL